MRYVQASRLLYIHSAISYGRFDDAALLFLQDLVVLRSLECPGIL